MIVPEALPVARSRFVLLDELVVHGRVRPQISCVVPLRCREEHRDVGAGDVTGNHHLRPSLGILSEVGELTLRR